jgi:hypothetical protein
MASRNDSRLNSLLSSPNLTLAEVQQAAFGGVPDVARATVWKLLLNYLPLEKAGREEHLRVSRAQYAQFVEATSLPFGKGSRALSSLGEAVDSALEDASSAEGPAPDRPPQWSADDELRREIEKDIERTCPDLDWFTHADHTEPMRRILFVYAKLNSGVAYVQGMHEVLAPLWFVMATERVAVAMGSGRTGEPLPPSSPPPLAKFGGSTAPGTPAGRGDSSAPRVTWEPVSLADAEADCFHVFMGLMAEIRDVFIESHDHSETGIRGMLGRYTRLLARREPEVAAHFKALNLDPQFYAMRWIMTLLSREFSFPEVVSFWDSLFADPHRFAFLLQLAVAMVRMERVRLLRADFGTAMKLLQKYPGVDFLGLLATAIEIRAEEGAEAARDSHEAGAAAAAAGAGIALGGVAFGAAATASVLGSAFSQLGGWFTGGGGGETAGRPALTRSLSSGATMSLDAAHTLAYSSPARAVAAGGHPLMTMPLGPAVSSAVTDRFSALWSSRMRAHSGLL